VDDGNLEFAPRAGREESIYIGKREEGGNE